MTSVPQIDEEMLQLQRRMEELAKAKREKEEEDELMRTSTDHNLTTLKLAIAVKQDKVDKFRSYNYQNSYQVHAWSDNNRTKEEIGHLSAIYNILSIMNTRLSKLEEGTE